MLPNIPGEVEYLGKGVSYCSTCDGAFFKDKTVVAVGGPNAAVMSAMHLAQVAEKVYLIYRKKPLRADPIWVKRVEEEKKIEILYETNVLAVLGDGQKVTALKIDKSYQGKDQLKTDRLFIEIGGAPGVDLVKKMGVELDEKGYIQVKPDMSTNMVGVFAAGDVANSTDEFQQIVTATARVDWGYAPDFVDAMVRILALEEPGDFVVATGEARSVGAFVEVAFGLAGPDWRRHVVEDRSLVARPSPTLVGDARRLRAATGWAPTVRFEEMVGILFRAALARAGEAG